MRRWRQPKRLTRGATLAGSACFLTGTVYPLFFIVRHVFWEMDSSVTGNLILGMIAIVLYMLFYIWILVIIPAMFLSFLVGWIIETVAARSNTNQRIVVGSGVALVCSAPLYMVLAFMMGFPNLISIGAVALYVAIGVWVSKKIAGRTLNEGLIPGG